MPTLKCVLALGLILASASPIAAQSGHSVSFVGAPWTSGSSSQGFYHAFICIATKLTSGIKEDCYGFYPAQAAKAAIGGPGKINGLDIRRIDAGSVATGYIDITVDQRRKIFAQIDEWSKKEYDLTDQNCIDFVDAIAAMLGVKRPSRIPTQKPVDYIQKLKSLNGI